MHKIVSPSAQGYPIIVYQSEKTRAINVGYIHKEKKKESFIPGRLLFGPLRETITSQAMIETFQLPEMQKILKKYIPQQISTITLLRETIACHLNLSLYQAGIKNHYGDAYIGATHIKGKGEIKTAYLYENTEGLNPHGLWIMSDSFCIGRNLIATMNSLLSKFHPDEILFIGTLTSRRGINAVGEVIAAHHIPTSFVAWGALFGVDEKTLYDMPWGHNDTEPLDLRDQQTFVSMYGPKLCVGGDFGNNYYSPTVALDLYKAQLKDHGITPKFPTVQELRRTYKPGELWEYNEITDP